MIEPVPQPSDLPPAEVAALRTEPVVLEDLAALIRLPSLFEKLDRVMLEVQRQYVPPEDFPFRLLADRPGDGVREYGLSFSDPQRLLRTFAGISWGAEGHDPIWEVRVEALPALDPARVRNGGFHRIAAKRAETRFSDWDRFWHEDNPKSWLLFGASASCTRFFEEDHPDSTAANYLASALYALQSSGALQALLNLATQE
ncbi:MAG: hypothetical protein MK209_06870 [Planctomycetes bacterium]|nr:hypothetical protein [Planctomycetota bacterium]